MTVPHHVPAARAPSLMSALGALRRRGMRVSTARRHVLEECGLVRHVHLGHGPGRYSLATSETVEFVTCERCGTFQALHSHRLDAVREVIERECGFVARFTHFPIVGICPACQSAPNQDAIHAHS